MFYLFFYFLKILFIYFQRGGREEERQGEKHQCVGASQAASTGDLAYNPGRYSDWELNQWPLDLQPALNPLSYTSQGEKECFRVLNSTHVYFVL